MKNCKRRQRNALTLLPLPSYPTLLSSTGFKNSNMHQRPITLHMLISRQYINHRRETIAMSS
jgi:hypothetical protein